MRLKTKHLVSSKITTFGGFTALALCGPLKLYVGLIFCFTRMHRDYNYKTIIKLYSAKYLPTTFISCLCFPSVLVSRFRCVMVTSQ